MKVVVESFNKMPNKNINNVILTLQDRSFELMKVKGGSNYKLPHMGKGKLASLSQLLENLECPSDIIEAAKHII